MTGRVCPELTHLLVVLVKQLVELLAVIFPNRERKRLAILFFDI